MKMPNSVLTAVSAVVLILLASTSSLAEDTDGIFTSNNDLQDLILTGAELVRRMAEYIREEEDRILKLKSLMRGYESMRDEAAADEERFVGNPLNSYLLIKKMTSDWKAVQEVINSSPSQAFLANLTGTPATDLDDDEDYPVSSVSSSLRWPSEEDLSGAAVALVRLQDTYRLDTADLAAGNLNGVDYGRPLSAHDCFELGRQAYNVGDHKHANSWMAQALKVWETEDEKTVDRADVLEYQAFSAYIQGNMRRALRLTEDLLALNPDHPRASGNKAYYETSITSEGGKMRKKGEDGLGDAEDSSEFTVTEEEDDPAVLKESERDMYERLCRGEQTLSEEYKSKLSCRYTSGEHPWLLLSPHKEETVFLEPRILLYHDVLTDDEIDTVKSLASPRFKRATVQNYKTGELETANYRISKTAWIKREEHRDIDKIYQRVGDVTGLNMETSEELQVSNYGIGGHYEPHFDFARREEKNAFSSLGTGNRIATWLFYESDVDLGGATVFPQLGIGLWPKKGSAVFWYNLHRNGEGDDMTRHAACPVLAGTKWVSNFWIHERGQEFVRPCDKSPFK